MMTPDVLGKVIGRGNIAALNESFLVNLLTAVQRTKNVLGFCMRFGEGVSLLHSMDFSHLQHAWDIANVALQDLMGSAVDLAGNQNDRRCPVCLDLVLLWESRIPACGHPIHMSCWRLYRDQMLISGSTTEPLQRCNGSVVELKIKKSAIPRVCTVGPVFCLI
jgi:hypothetical protein